MWIIPVFSTGNGANVGATEPILEELPALIHYSSPKTGILTDGIAF
jgi:hypothetical protein